MFTSRNKTIQTGLLISFISLLLSTSSWALDEIKFKVATQNNASINNYALEYKDARFADPILEAKRKNLIDILLKESTSKIVLGDLFTSEMVEVFLNYETFRNFFVEQGLNIDDYKQDFLNFYQKNSAVIPFNILYRSKVKISSVNKNYGSQTSNTSVQNTVDLTPFFGQTTWPTRQAEFSRLVFDRVLENLKNNRHLIKFKKDELVADKDHVNGITRLFFYVLYEVDTFTRLFEESALKDLVEVAIAYQNSPMGDVRLKGENLAAQVKDADVIALTESDEMASTILTERYDRALVGEARTNDSRLLVNSKVFPRAQSLSFSNEDKDHVKARYLGLKSHASYLPDVEKKFIVPDEELAFARLQDVKGHSVFMASLHAGTSGADNIGSIAMIAEKYSHSDDAGPSPLIIAGDFNTNSDSSQSTDKLLIKDLRTVVAEISRLLGIKCTLYMPNSNTVDKTRAWTTQLNKVNVGDQAARDGLISCLKNAFANKVQIEVAPLGVGPMGVSEENASDHAKVETEIHVKFLE